MPTEAEKIAHEYSAADFFSGKPWPAEPFWFTYILHDIPATMAAAIRSLPAQCIGVTIVRQPSRHLPAISAALAERAMGVRWVSPVAAVLRRDADG